MKKLIVLGLSLLLTLGMATVTLAGDIETTGEFDFDYHGHHWTGESSRYTQLELGLKNHIGISDIVTGDLNFWLDTNGTDHNFKIDAGYVTFNFGGKTLKVGYDEYPLDASLNVMGDFVKNGLFCGGLKPAAVQLLGTVPMTDSITLQGGYFHNTGGNFNNNTKDSSGVMGDDGRDNFLLRGSYAAGKFNTNLTYLYVGEWVWDTVEPAAEYIIDAGYKINDKYRIYAAYIGVDKYYDNNQLGGKESADELDNFGIIGFSASLGKLWFSAEYAVLTPDKDENEEKVYYTDGSTIVHNWADNPPYGFSISYYFGYNTTLQYTRVADTGNSNDRDRLRLQVKF
ncbi:MAG TPA: hypothetical protein VEC37_19215 [Bacillota bacterium]|nr:hypothetical protein [Bacillota bacterium]